MAFLTKSKAHAGSKFSYNRRFRSRCRPILERVNASRIRSLRTFSCWKSYFLLFLFIWTFFPIVQKFRLFISFIFNMEDVRSDLTSVLSGLESHWAILETEIRELNADIANAEVCLQKYGEIFRLPLQHLKQLKRSKKAAMKDIVANLENLSANLQGGRRLLKNLSRNQNTVCL